MNGRTDGRSNPKNIAGCTCVPRQCAPVHPGGIYLCSRAACLGSPSEKSLCWRPISSDPPVEAPLYLECENYLEPFQKQNESEKTPTEIDLDNVKKSYSEWVFSILTA